ENVALAVVLHNVYGLRVVTSWTRESAFPVRLRPGVQAFECRFKNVNLRPGHTILTSVWMAAETVLDHVDQAVVVGVIGDQRRAHLSTAGDQGIVVCAYAWRELPVREED